MYLKEIQTSGFKSFAEKLTISLDNRTTCIVGPNGSGKSNIVDAVRWVLGEQSVKSLRGDSGMTDVIFAGSKSRSPLNVASVTLTFDNSDNYLNIPYNEVSVRRRVYRTGENEYFLNGERCRLKDITDLFIDSGIGKSSFNIISQGEIDKILSNSSVDRRSIFEEAAGVLKYKKRKEEALQKLEKTNDNMNRVQDIISELEVQVEPLREQKEKAEEYLSKKETLEKVEVALLASEIESINDNYLKAKDRRDIVSQEIFNTSVNSSSFDTDIIDKKNELSKIEEDIKEYNLELLSLTREEEKLNGEKSLIKERSKYSATDQKVHESISNLKENKLQTENAIYLHNKDLEILNNNFNNKQKELKELDDALSLKKKKYTELVNEYNYKRRDLFDINQNIEITTNNIENGNSLSTGVKSILNNPRLRGIHDVLSNLIESDEKYTKALEVVLASSKQNIIVDNEESAKEAINYLKENNMGRVTFLPLNTIKPRGIDPDIIKGIKDDSGFIDSFINLVSYEEKYHNIISNNLGNIIVSDNIDSATRISRKINNRYKIVTLDGDLFNVGGSITGGSLKNAKSIISYKQDLELLNKKKEEVTSLLKEYELSISEQSKDIELLEDKIYQEKSKLYSINEQIKNTNNLINDLSNKLNSTNTNLNSLSHVVDSSLDEEENRIIEKYYEVSCKKNETQKILNDITKKREKLYNKLEEVTAQSKINSLNNSKLEKELKELEISISKMEVKLDNYLNILNEDYELTYEKAKNNYKLDIDLDEARSLVARLKNDIKRLGMVNIASIEEFKRVNERYEFLSNQKNDLLNAKDTLLEIIGEMDNVMEYEFKKSFKAIDEEFRRVFKELFKGGDANIKLVDPNNVLESDILINASPPGKKLKAITLLSGGEKTLTAISLIFAILNVRTVPFCLFDEVEAALDEANVETFGNYLKHYKDKTQFLLITHKKKTMEFADTLYGVTMQESGVSRLVSVKLDNVE